MKPASDGGSGITTKTITGLTSGTYLLITTGVTGDDSPIVEGVISSVTNATKIKYIKANKCGEWLYKLNGTSTTITVTQAYWNYMITTLTDMG